MSFIARHLDNIREKPHHVRRQVAFLASGVITGVIALSWLGISLYTGAFALKGATVAQETSAEPAADETGGTVDNPGVAGAAAAEAATAPTAASGLDVVGAGQAREGGASADPGNPKSGKNIIPF